MRGGGGLDLRGADGGCKAQDGQRDPSRNGLKPGQKSVGKPDDLCLGQMGVNSPQPTCEVHAVKCE